MTSDFYFVMDIVYYVVRLWLLFKPSVLAGFFQHCSGKEGQTVPPYGQVEGNRFSALPEWHLGWLLITLMQGC